MTIAMPSSLTGPLDPRPAIGLVLAASLGWSAAAVASSPVARPTSTATDATTPASPAATVTDPATASATATATATASPADDAAPPRMIDRALDLIDELDRTRISVDWVEQPLLRVVTELETVHGVPLTVDWESLRELRVQERTVVSVRADALPAFSVLQMLALQVGDEFDRAVIEPWADRMVLTTSEALPRIMMSDVYDVRDLLSPDERAGGTSMATPGTPGAPGTPGPDASAPEQDGDDDRGARDPGADDARNGDADDANDAGERAPDRGPLGRRNAAPSVLGAMPSPPEDFVERRANSPAEALLASMLEHVDPEGWARSGGMRGRITERDGILIISAPATTHRNLRRMLDTLRRTAPRGLNLQVVVLQVPPGTWDTIDRRYDPSTEIFARRLMDAAGVTRRWSQRSSVAIGDTCRIRDEPGAAAVDQPTVGLEITPTFAVDTGTLTLAIDFSWRDGGLRTLNSRLPVPMLGGALSVSLPGAASPDGETVLVVLPDRY
ncbi:MAG: hypothetical protein AB8G96_14255 [Phycisphaerales bacterium]